MWTIKSMRIAMKTLIYYYMVLFQLCSQKTEVNILKGKLCTCWNIALHSLNRVFIIQIKALRLYCQYLRSLQIFSLHWNKKIAKYMWMCDNKYGISIRHNIKWNKNKFFSAKYSMKANWNAVSRTTMNDFFFRYLRK